MRFAAGLSTSTSSREALEQACREAAEGIQGAPVDLALLFLSQHHSESFDEIARGIRERLRPRAFLGCTTGGVIGRDREVENRAGLALWLAHLPGVGIESFHLRFDPEEKEISGWPGKAPPPSKKPSFLLLPDPFSTPADDILQKLNQDYPGAPVFGGMASGAVIAGQNRLFRDEEILEEGTVGAVITGPVSIRTVVSQGCRPVGKPFVITQGERNIIKTLGGETGLKRLQETFASLAPAEQQLFRRGLHVGRVVNELQDSFRRGEFIVRNVMGIDPESGAIAIGDFVRKGQTVQFHVRDADSAREDLRLLLAREREEGSTKEGPAGALLFSCNGRGVHLFGEPNHDVSLVREILGGLPVAGFFAQGEIGPIGGRNFLHGFTASLAIFGEP